jgi:hypothetical protein
MGGLPYFVFLGAYIHHKRGSEQGELTITDLDLNRPELLEKRYERIKDISNTIDRCFRTQSKRLRELALTDLKKEYDPDKEYSACIQQVIKSQEVESEN